MRRADKIVLVGFLSFLLIGIPALAIFAYLNHEPTAPVYEDELTDDERGSMSAMRNTIIMKDGMDSYQENSEKWEASFEKSVRDWREFKVEP